MTILRQLVFLGLVFVPIGVVQAKEGTSFQMPERQITDQQQGHILTNIGIWSPDSCWIAYDTRSDAAGESFDGSRIERVNIHTRQVELIYESTKDAHCGVVTYNPKAEQVVFIHGPELPSDDWQYAAFHRRGVLVKTDGTGRAVNLDARDIVPPFQPGALRGGTHVHTFHGRGDWVAFTYEDHVLANSKSKDASKNQRNVGVSVPGKSVSVSNGHPRNHSGSMFTVLVTRTVDNPTPGSDEISRAFSDAWIGANGYEKSGGERQVRAIAFQGQVSTLSGDLISEVFVVDIPTDVSVPSELGPLQGTPTSRPMPPAGTLQRRITFTSDRKYPGIQGPRHWLRSSPDGSMIAFLMKDDNGIVQIWTVSPNGGALKQVTRNDHSIESAFSWNPTGRFIAHVMDQRICVTQLESGRTIPLTEPSRYLLRPEACVVSPDGRKIGYVRRVAEPDQEWNQIFIVSVPEDLPR